MPDTRIYMSGRPAMPPSPLHAHTYEQQRQASPSETMQALAWNQFGSSDVRLASPDRLADRALIDRVVTLCQRKNINDVPEIYIIGSHIPNAASVNGEGLILTTRLMNEMSPEALDAVIGHELSHHRHFNRDATAITALGLSGSWLAERAWLMATTRLARGGLNPNLLRFMNSNVLMTPVHYLGATLPLVPYRHFMEYEADREGALATRPQHMKEALATLNSLAKQPDSERERSIGNRIVRTLLYPFSTHPPTDKRLRAIEQIERRCERLQEKSSEPARG